MGVSSGRLRACWPRGRRRVAIERRACYVSVAGLAIFNNGGQLASVILPTPGMGMGVPIDLKAERPIIRTTSQRYEPVLLDGNEPYTANRRPAIYLSTRASPALSPLTLPRNRV